MRTLQQWYDEYAISHQNPKNKAIHYVCVPAIYFAIVGLLLCIPNSILNKISGLNLPIITNWATLAILFVIVFYARISVATALKMGLFSMACLLVNYYLGRFIELWIFDISVFVIAWIGQFYGHKIEGKKPSFLKDLQFLMIGPAWVIDAVFEN